MPREEVRRRQLAMYSHRADVLYDAPDSRVGTNFLSEVSTRCVPILTNQTQPPKSGWDHAARLLVKPCFSRSPIASPARPMLELA